MSVSEYGVIIQAGTVESWTTNHSHQQSIEDVLNHIAEKAGSQLAAGARAFDVVQDAVAAMEICELFNAGKGAALNEDGEHEVRSHFTDVLKDIINAIESIARSGYSGWGIRKFRCRSLCSRGKASNPCCTRCTRP